MGKRNRHLPKQQTVEPLPVNLMIGNCIVVEPGVKDPDYGRDIGGWQGRVTEIESYQPGKVTIMFQWTVWPSKLCPLQ